MKLEDIGFYTLSNERALNSSINTPLWRCELILTNKCNFKCPYCRHVETKDISYDEGLKILNLWINHHNLQNIRFSGGEPTLHKYLPDFVKFAKGNGVKRIAISTNGSADIDYYKKLITYGVNDFSISLDACCSNTSKIMSGIENVHDRIIRNIKKLSKLTYVTVGIVFDDRNEDEIEKIIELAYDLGVSDIRVIPSAQFDNKIKNIKISKNILDKCPILKYRMINNHNVRGLETNDAKKCKLVLDDMAVMNGYHYPCIIYLREGGKPIGKVSENMRKERMEWYNKHNSWKDKICRTNCLDVCVDYNNVAEFGG